MCEMQNEGKRVASLCPLHVPETVTVRLSDEKHIEKEVLFVWAAW
jgi:hypothetical protein